MNKVFINHFYEDPSHGWLAVKYKDLVEFGIEQKISSCSYMDGDYVYLEEDQDMWVFIEAIKQDGWRIDLIKHYDQNTSIRRLPTYVPHIQGVA